MDAAQMITSAVAPGAATLPVSADFSSGTSAASPQFREMFSKATLAAGATLVQQSAAIQSGLSGSLPVNGRGAGLAVQGLALSGGGKAGLSVGQLETELFAGAEILLTADVSTREKKVEGSDLDGTTRESLRQTSADGAGNSALAMLSAGFVNVPVLPETAATVAHTVTESVRGAFLAVPVAGNAAETVENQVVSLDQPETRGIRSISDADTEVSALNAEAAGTVKTAGLEVSAVSQDLKEMSEVVPGGEKLVGKDHGNVARHENGPAMKQVPHDQNPAGKGETVMRELPRGVTVLNPAQTLTMGRPAMTADVAPLAVQGTERGRISPREGEVREEHGRQISLAGEAEKIVRNTEGYSSQNNSNLGHDSTSQGGNHAVPQTAAASGAFDAVAKAQLEPLSEVPREHEVSELHQNILSQVREKLVSQDSSGTVSKISLKLNPHELGEMQISVRLEDQKMRVDITAQNPVVKEALLQNIEQLKDSLLRQNISMERFHVSTGDGGQAFNQSFREGRQTAQHTQDTFTYPLSGYYQEDPRVSQAAYADSRENSLVDMRF